jgi:hypothetical protein
VLLGLAVKLILGLGGSSSRVDQANRHAFANRRGGFLNSSQEHAGIVGIKEAIKLTAAGFHTLRHLAFAYASLSHGFGHWSPARARLLLHYMCAAP